jgi:erythromycin esterase-like protein
MHLSIRRLSLTALAGSMAVSLAVGLPLGPAQAAPDAPLDRWLERHARPAVALPVGDAVVVGLGESAHGAHEIATLKQRALRRLVVRHGFRSVAWEEDWTTGRAIDRYLTTGHGSATELAGRMTAQWRSREVVSTLRWLRAFDRTHHADPVRFVGVEYYYTGRPAYDAVRRYVARHTPRLLPALRADYRVIYPDLADPEAYAAEYAEVAAKAPYLRHAHHLARLLRAVEHRPGDPAYSMVRQHARQIVAFHEHYALDPAAQDDYREVHAARTLRWWQRRTGDRVAYWAATPHTASARHLRIALPGMPDFGYRPTGSYLRQWYGDRYLSVDVTFDHGRVGLPGEVTGEPPAEPGWMEAPLAGVGRDRFLVDLRTPAPSAVRSWLGGRLTTRGMPWAPGSTVTGGPAGDWFDVLVHAQRVTPQHAA